MAKDFWNGTGDWFGTLADWSDNAPPSTTEAAEIQTGTVTLSSSSTVQSVLIDSGATLALGNSASLSTTAALVNVGALNITGDGDTVSIGKTLTNIGSMVIGGGSLGVSTTVTVAGLTNTGSLVLQGATVANAVAQATLHITGPSSATVTASTRIGGDADLQVQTGLTSISSGVTLELDGSQARVSIGSAASNSALTGLTSNAGTLLLRGNSNLGAGGVSITTNAAFNNRGNLYIDNNDGDGGSTVTLGGVLTNSGTAIIGNTDLGNSATAGASTTVTATGLNNSGILVLDGNTTSGSANRTILHITAATSGTLAAFIRVSGNADLQLTTGIAAIASGGSFELDGGQALAALGSASTNTALQGLANNAGTLLLRSNGFFGSGAVSVSTAAGFHNNNIFNVDPNSGEGGTILKLGGVLNNAGKMVIGNGSLSAATTVTAIGLNNSGTVILQGSSGSGAVPQATLGITGATSTTTAGYIRVGGNADLQLKTGITAVGSGGNLEVDGASARVSLGSGNGNSALSGLVSNAGTVTVRGNSGFGSGAGSLTTSAGLDNTGTVNVDSYDLDGGSALTLGGKLTNSGILQVGNGDLVAATSVTVDGLDNTGRIVLQGSTGGGTPPQATLDVTGNTATATGFMRIAGNADLELATGLTKIDAAGFLEIDGNQARASLGSGTANNALTGLLTSYGTLLLRGNSEFGSGAPLLTTTSSYYNSGTLGLDQYGGDGGAVATFGGGLINSGTAVIGNGGLSAATTVNASSLINSGSLTLSGGSAHQATLALSGNAINTGALAIGGSAALVVASNAIFTQSAGTATVSGTLTASTVSVAGGVLDFTSALTSSSTTGALSIRTGGTLQFDAAVDASRTVTFSGAAAGTLNLGAIATFAGHIAGFAGGDAIDVLNSQVTALSYSGNTTAGTLHLTNGSGAVGDLMFKGNYNSASFSAVSDGHNGTTILFNG